MSKGPIKVSVQGLNIAIKSITSAKEDYDDAIRSIETTINSLDEVWQGSAQQSMKDAFFAAKPLFTQFSQAIEQYAKDIESFRNDFTDTDQALKASIANNS